jgi:hypothetical protein
MGLFDFLFGGEDEIKQVPTISPAQERILRSLSRQGQQLQRGGYGDAISLLQQYLNPQSDVYSNFEAPYLQQFYNEIIPNIAERFAGLDPMGGALSSSGFGQALGAAGSNLQTQLAGMKSGMQRQSISDLLGQYNQLNNTALGVRPFENVYQQGSTGAFGGLLSGLGGGLGMAIGAPLGAGIGSSLGSGFGNLFSNQMRSGGLSTGGNYPII